MEYAVVALAGRTAAPETGLSKSDELLLNHAIFLGSWHHPTDELRGTFLLSPIPSRSIIARKIESLAVILEQRRSLSGTEVAEIIGSVGQ